jgi:phosphoserine phosphatase RsbU/P
LSSHRSLLGVTGLGPKQSEEPFTSADIRLLGAVAAQTGLALENTQSADGLRQSGDIVRLDVGGP